MLSKTMVCSNTLIFQVLGLFNQIVAFLNKESFEEV